MPYKYASTLVLLGHQAAQIRTSESLSGVPGLEIGGTARAMPAVAAGLAVVGEGTTRVVLRYY